jgi:magnesium transporter
MPDPAVSDRASNERTAQLLEAVSRAAPYEAHELLAPEPEALIVGVLTRLNPAFADQILWEFSEEQHARVLAAAPAPAREQWLRNHAFPAGTVGRMMEPPVALFRAEQTVRQVVARLEQLVKRSFVTYGWITDGKGALQGVLVFRELLFASPDTPVGEIMVKQPFALRADTPIALAMKEALKRHFPVYPVCDADRRLIGILRGQTLFEQQAFEISAQIGTIVGVEKSERLATSWLRSFKFRHPWLQLNLFTAFIAASVVGLFEHTINQLVVLAVFLPVLAGQSGNTGCQALAVVLRAMTLNELDRGQETRAIVKETCLGFLNGSLVGLTAALAMWLYARGDQGTTAINLALVVLLSMAGSCTISGMSGAAVPIVLRRLGADPASASSIFLTTVTDVVSMGMFLGLAQLLVL